LTTVPRLFRAVVVPSTSKTKQTTHNSTPRLPCTQQTRRQGGHQAGPTEVHFLSLRGHGYCQPFHRAGAGVFALLGDDAREGRREMGPSLLPQSSPTTATTSCYLCPPFSESSSAKASELSKKEKNVALTKEEYLRLVAQPYVYCATREKIGVDRVRNSESYTRENAAPCCGRVIRGI